MPIRFRSLTSRIAFGYLVLIVIALLVVGIVFNSLLRDHLVRDAQRSLLREAQAMAEIASTSGPGQPPGKLQGGKRVFALATTFTEGDYIITDQHLTIVDSNRMDEFPPGSVLKGSIADTIASKGLGEGKQLQFSTRDFVVVAVPIWGSASEIKGMVVLLTAVETVKTITGQLVRLLLWIMLAAGAVAVLIAFVLARSITRPLRQLRRRALNIASRDFSGRVSIQTGDEMEELAESLNVMASRLEEYDAAQRRLIQNASHELKTPLMSIQGYAEAIKDGVIGEGETEKSLEIIIRESRRLKKMVEDIIYLSKLESLEEEYVYHDLELEELLHEAVELTGGVAGERGIAVDFSPDTAISIRGDGEKLLRVFVNILGNGIRHARSKVTVGVRSQDGGASIVFEDDGEGFSDQDLERMFERFYKGNKEGSGLGMAIALAIIKKHGGTITPSNTSSGARVDVYLPKSPS